MNRADRRAQRRDRVAPGKLSALRQVTLEDLNTVALALLLDSGAYGKLHAGIAKGPGPGRPFCGAKPSMWQHPLFTRDPNFGPGVKAELRHQYALAALHLNGGCVNCIAQMEEIGRLERIDPEYPYFDPQRAVG